MDVESTTFQSSHDLKKLISDSLCNDITSGNFDVGHMHGTNVVRVLHKGRDVRNLV